MSAAGVETYQAPSPGQVNVAVDPNSKRLQLLQPFAAWNGKDIEVGLGTIGALGSLLVALSDSRQSGRCGSLCSITGCMALLPRSLLHACSDTAAHIPNLSYSMRQLEYQLRIFR